MQAGIQLKNALYSKDPAIRVQYQTRWMSFPEDLRAYVKRNVSLHYTDFLFDFCRMQQGSRA